MKKSKKYKRYERYFRKIICEAFGLTKADLRRAREIEKKRKGRLAFR